jgi:hypothetical protein
MTGFGKEISLTQQATENRPTEIDPSKLAGSLNSSGLETVTRRFENEPNSNPEAGEDIDERISAK